MPLSTLVNVDSNKIGPLSVSHQSQFPAVTLSFNLPQGTALGQAVDAIRQAETQIGKPESLIGSFQGNAQAFQDSLSSEPLLILAALIVVYVILGVLYESFVHPVTILSTLPSAGVGALLALYVGGFDLSVIGIVGIILLIGIVKKNGIMLVDFAINARTRGRDRGGRDPRGGAAALPADPDDHAGGAARRRRADALARRRLGAAPAARIRDGRRACAQSGADAVHDAGGLSLPRPPAELDARRSGAARTRSPRGSRLSKGCCSR